MVQPSSSTRSDSVFHDSNSFGPTPYRAPASLLQVLGRELGLSQPSASRLIAALEEEVGARSSAAPRER